MTTAAPKLTICRSLAVAAALAAGAFTTVSFGASFNEETPSVAVRYDDLNLATSAGVDALYRRISSAARQVCPDEHSRDLVIVAASERCQADAVSRAVSELKNPKLAAMHAERISHG